jgi:hypothetical protein
MRALRLAIMSVSPGLVGLPSVAVICLDAQQPVMTQQHPVSLTLHDHLLARTD